MPQTHKSQVLNFLWLNLDCPAKPDPEGGAIRKPMPEEYIRNIREAGKRHPAAEIHFWVDSKRLTEKQMAYLKCAVTLNVSNIHVKDLRTIPAYDAESLYNEGETNKNWRQGWAGKIWLQIDAAKILISLQGDFDQSFFADLDHAHLDIESDKVQNMLNRHGLMIGSGSRFGVCIENQLWGFERRQRPFFNKYYKTALKSAYRGKNGFEDLCDMARKFKEKRWLICRRNVPLCEIVLPIGSKGLAHATQPGHEWHGKHGKQGKKSGGAEFISARKVAKIFNLAARAKKSEEAPLRFAAVKNTGKKAHGLGLRI